MVSVASELGPITATGTLGSSGRTPTDVKDTIFYNILDIETHSCYFEGAQYFPELILKLIPVHWYC